MNYYNMIEEAWSLSEAALLHVKGAGRAVDAAELWTDLFSRSPLVDLDKTRQEGRNSFIKIFLKSPYGIQYRAECNDWVPFRHGAIDFKKDASLA